MSSVSLPRTSKQVVVNVDGLDLISRTDSLGNQEYELSDGLGSTTGLADGTGAVTDTYTYDVYGAVRTRTGTSPNEFTYTGEQVDSSGLQYLRARYYDAATGRFASRDPLPFAQRYAYVGGNPANLVDPTGLCSKWPPSEYKDCVRKAAEKAAEVAKDTAVAAAGWLSNPDNLALAAQTAAGFTMTMTCGPQAVWAPSAGACIAAAAVYIGATDWQMYRAGFNAGAACIGVTSSPAFLPGMAGVGGRIFKFVDGLTGAMCEPGTAQAMGASSHDNKEGGRW
jgi:RHS repeat-associated protein